MLTDGIEYIVEALPDGRRFTAKSILKLTPKKEHHNTTFTCQAQNTADRTYRSAKLRLEVKYAPKVRNNHLLGLSKDHYKFKSQYIKLKKSIKLTIATP